MERVTKKITQEDINEINATRKECGFEPTKVKVDDEIIIYKK